MESVPVVDAFALSEWVWVVPCPFCAGLHHHSAAPGHRSPHCAAGMGPAGAYVPRLAGPVDAAMRSRAMRQRGQNRAFLRFLLDARS